MKYQLETIPVLDAYSAGTECPHCLLQSRAEESYVEFFLGNSVMVPEMRLQVNDAGFCPRHFTMLLDGGNRLGLSLLTQTHIVDLRSRLEARHRALRADGGGRGRGARLGRDIAALAGALREQSRRCLLCDRLGERLLRYTFTVAYLWDKEQDFRRQLAASKGFCLEHLAAQLAMARETLAAARAAELVVEILDVQERAWDRLERELLAFAGHFDYRSSGRAAESTREAVAEAIQKLTGEWLAVSAARRRGG
jgi:hypothetical protein